MNRTFWKMTVAFACACALHAQSANPLITESKQGYTAIKTNLLKAAEKMPAEAYDFKPVPEIRSFGQLIAHIADAQTRNCTAVKGETKAATAASKTKKDDLVAALKDSIADCDSAWETVTDASAMEMLKFRTGQRSRLGILIYTTGHNNEEYGYLAVYLRLKGVVPPSSEGR
jgi:uncharacterized damage-inducible protein DinB